MATAMGYRFLRYRILIGISGLDVPISNGAMYGLPLHAFISFTLDSDGAALFNLHSEMPLIDTIASWSRAES